MLTAHEQKLAENYVPLAKKLANKYAQVWFNGCEDDYEELVSRFTEEIVRCTKTYKEGKGGFSAYMYRVAHNEAVDYFKEKKAIRSREFFLGDIVDHRDYEDEIVGKVMVEDFMESLDEDEAYLINLVLGGKTQKECADCMTYRFEKKYSQVIISKMCKKIRKKFALAKRIN